MLYFYLKISGDFVINSIIWKPFNDSLQLTMLEKWKYLFKDIASMKTIETETKSVQDYLKVEKTHAKETVVDPLCVETQTTQVSGI